MYGDPAAPGRPARRDPQRRLVEGRARPDLAPAGPRRRARAGPKSSTCARTTTWAWPITPRSSRRPMRRSTTGATAWPRSGSSAGRRNRTRRLEQAISEFLGTEDTILYSSCWDANGGLFETILGAEDAVISDELNHASIIDGIRLCKASGSATRTTTWPTWRPSSRRCRDARFRLIATDGVFSMDGIIADLKSVCDLADKYDALVMVDDSHAVGFLGKHGRGTHEYRDVMGRVDILTGTLGKALGGASGGYTSARSEIVAILRQRSRPYLFSNSVAPPILGASLKAIEICRRSTELRDRLEANTKFFRAAMTEPEVQHRPGRAPDHADHDRRRRAGRQNGRSLAGERGLCDRFLLPRRPARQGPRPRPGLGGPHPRRSGIRHRRIYQSARRAGVMMCSWEVSRAA